MPFLSIQPAPLSMEFISHDSPRALQDRKVAVLKKHEMHLRTPFLSIRFDLLSMELSHDSA